MTRFRGALESDDLGELRKTARRCYGVDDELFSQLLSESLVSEFSSNPRTPKSWVCLANPYLVPRDRESISARVSLIQHKAAKAKFESLWRQRNFAEAISFFDSLPDKDVAWQHTVITKITEHLRDRVFNAPEEATQILNALPHGGIFAEAVPNQVRAELRICGELSRMTLQVQRSGIESDLVSSISALAPSLEPAVNDWISSVPNVMRRTVEVASSKNMEQSFDVPLLPKPPLVAHQPRVESALGLLQRTVSDACHNFLAESVLASCFERKAWSHLDRWLNLGFLDADKRNDWIKRKAAAISKSLPEQLRPDTAQAQVIASPDQTVRVTARAGSGKTHLLTVLTYFLVESYGLEPSEILLLAFNRDAAGQIEERLTRLLKIPSFPGARTFHSLAFGIAAPEQEVLFDQGEEVSTRQLTAMVQATLVEMHDDALLAEIYELFRRETAEAKSTGAFLSGEDAYDFRRTLKQFSLGGQSVKSKGEKYIADFLFEHGITFAYEHRTSWIGGGWYRPDFKIKVAEKNWIVWEHWMVDPDSSVSPGFDFPEKQILDYQVSAKQKREFWKKKGIPLIESCAQDCGNRKSFEAIIARKLQPFFPNLNRLPKAACLKRMKDVHLSRLSGWVSQAIQRAQKRGWNSRDLREALASYGASTERETLFLALVERVFTAYEPRLVRENKTDFDRIFNEAIRLMRADPPQTTLNSKKATIDLRQVRVCLVDEAQDLSPQFLEAVTCLREINPALRLLFVGDDWQAINRFAGSDVELFTRTITKRFGKCATPTLATNYRSVRKVVLAGNALMQGQGAAAEPFQEVMGVIQLAYIDTVWVERREGSAGWKADAPFRQCGAGGEKFFKTLYQLAVPDLAAGKTVGVLFRTNRHLGERLGELSSRFAGLLRQMGWPSETVREWQQHQIRFSTAHRFKGGERQTVFVVNPFAGSFPLLNADSIELFRFFGESLDQAERDERRLFYVAVTRAKERLVFLTEKRREDDSPYLDSFRDQLQTIEVPGLLYLPPDFRDRPGEISDR